MKDLQVSKLPDCDICQSKGTGVYDAPTKQGPWANMCEACYKAHHNGTIGTRRVVKVVEKSDDPGKIAIGIEDDSMEYLEDVLVGDGMREIECPECGSVRHVEPDADYTYDCECGVKVKVSDPIAGIF